MSSKLSKLLPLIYLKAAMVEPKEPIYDETPEKFVDENDYEAVRGDVQNILGDKDQYLTAIHPDIALSDSVIAASISDREVDLSKVYVPMKISVIRDKDHSDEIVKAISTSANSQTAIKNSDFSANEPFLVDLENCSRSEWVPNGKSKPICKWYFERTRGQYFDQLAQLSGFNEKSFRIEYPKNQNYYAKTDSFSLYKIDESDKIKNKLIEGRKVMKGSGYFHEKSRCGVAYRRACSPTDKYTFGFRLAE